MKKLILLLSVAGSLIGCDFARVRNEGREAQRVIDSMRTELVTQQHFTETLLQVGSLLDSIDVNRHALKTNMLEGTDRTQYVSRLEDLNQYVQTTERKVQNLEQALKSKGNLSSTYKAALNKMRSELDMRNQELAALKEEVGTYKVENDRLSETVSQQRSELADQAKQLALKQEANDKLDNELAKLIDQSRVDQAESLFMRAETVEELANRTHFAPRKRRESREEALELYRLALAFGKSDAQARIDALQREL